MKPIKIYSIQYNRADFVEWQRDSFAHFLKDPHELIIVNNARDKIFRDEINDTAARLGLKTIQTHSDQPFSLAGFHHAESMNYVWKNHMVHEHGAYTMMVDGDCFMVTDFSVNEFMKNSILGGTKQQRNYVYHYLTPVVIMMDIDQLPEPETIDWIGDLVDETYLDTGGNLHLYLVRHPEVKAKVRGMHNTRHIKPEYNNLHCLPNELLASYQPQWNVEFFGNEFLHFFRSSNWDWKSPEHHQAKSDWVKKFVYGAIDGTIRAKRHDYQIPDDTICGWGRWVS